MAELTDKLINFAYLKNEVDVPQNIQSAEFDHKIYRAQERLRMIMGDAFYQDFLTTYKLAGSPFASSANYLALYSPYVKQFIAWQAFVYWTVEVQYKPTASGYRVMSEDNSVAATEDQMSIMIKDRKQQAEYYANLLTDFLNSNYENYPLYENSCRKSSSNSFHISAVRRKHYHEHNCNCGICR
jgi:hypothetical protein